MIKINEYHLALIFVSILSNLLINELIQLSIKIQKLQIFQSEDK